MKKLFFSSRKNTTRWFACGLLGLFFSTYLLPEGINSSCPLSTTAQHHAFSYSFVKMPWARVLQVSNVYLRIPSFSALTKIEKNFLDTTPKYSFKKPCPLPSMGQGIIRALVVDLRGNSDIANGSMESLLEEFARHQEHVYVITDKSNSKAVIHFIDQLKKLTTVTLVGQPTSLVGSNEAPKPDLCHPTPYVPDILFDDATMQSMDTFAKYNLYKGSPNHHAPYAFWFDAIRDKHPFVPAKTPNKFRKHVKKHIDTLRNSPEGVKAALSVLEKVAVFVETNRQDKKDSSEKSPLDHLRFWTAADYDNVLAFLQEQKEILSIARALVP